MAAVSEEFVLSYGVQIASSWVNMMLYMLELVMCLRYFRRSSPSRPLVHKFGVGALILLDTACTMAVDANTFETFLLSLGKESFFSLSVPTSVTIFMTYSTASVEQLFLCHLYFFLTRNRITSMFLVVIVVLHLAFSFASGILLQTADLGNPWPFTTNIVGAVLCAVTDVLIAGLLSWEFFKIRPSQNSQRRLIRRIYILCVTSGAIVACTTILMLILFLKGDIAFQFFFSCQGRVYALTLLANFLSRPSFSGTSSTSNEARDRVDVHPGPLGSARKSPPPSLYSNSGEDSLTKELPPLPVAKSISSLPTPTFASASFVLPSPHFASSPGTPQTIPSPRMIISAPDRVESLQQTV
ncbi:hypothetical protein DFH07DRAFT_839328 [Mycena maculata]|uniref:DUF6534 domain-containing protein n=1 Tax=Mycena maculata TaxID=230809 RepID=A0AAD7N1I7_9AGAR|nr:hypothetical protein DFH07DRAFT_839328 [Mycena maculata]